MGRHFAAELVHILRTPGLGRLARKYWRTGGGEIARSLVPPLLVKAARALVPAVGRGDFVRAGAGVRAQALSSDGALVDDFVFAEGEGVLVGDQRSLPGRHRFDLDRPGDRLEALTRLEAPGAFRDSAPDSFTVAEPCVRILGVVI